MERAAREQADQKVSSMSAELEELSQSLFEEANAMVKAEREKCARLEARLQIMENREEDNKRRLTVLENAIGRITRVRGILGKGVGVVSTVG
jgi:low affinity Fe/Cu permease